MARELFRLTQSLHNTPHLITADSLESIVEFLEDRNNRRIQLTTLDNTREINNEINYYADAKLGFITLDGPLTYIQYEGLCGPSGPSYQAIRQDFDRMVKAGAKTIVLDLDTPGGEAYQSFETAEHIRQVANENGVKIIAYVDGHAASAGYIFASVADEIVMNPMAQVGSIGAVIKLRNVNKAMQKQGVTDTYVFAGKSKIPFDSEGEFSKEFISDMQTLVDKAYGTFVSHVVKHRGLSEQVVIDTEAKMFEGKDALNMGLADKVMTLNEFSEYLENIVGDTKEDMALGNKFFNKDKEGTQTMKTENTDLEAQLTAMKEQFEESQAVMATQLAQLTEQLTNKNTELANAMEQLDSIKAEKEQMKAISRKDKLSAVLPEDKVESIASSLSALDDDAFAIVLSGYTASANALAASDLMTELGSQGEEVDSTTDAASAATLALIQSKLNIK